MSIPSDSCGASLAARMRLSVLTVTAVLVFVAAAAPAARDSARAPVDSSQQIATRIVESEIPVLVDFWAVWCGPCKMVTPIIDKLEKEYHGKVLFVKVNVDVHRAISQYFGVMSIPSIFVIREKTVHRALPGVRRYEDYKRALDEVLATKPAADSTAADTSSAGTSTGQ